MATAVKQSTFPLFNHILEEFRVLVWEDFFLEQFERRPRAYRLIHL